MDRNSKTKKGMKISSKTRVKVAGLINDLHLLQSLPGTCNDVAKNYKLGCQFLKYLKEIEYINSDKATVNYHNPKNYSADYVLDYVMSRYQCEYEKEIKTDTPSDNSPLLAVDIKKASRLSLTDLNLKGAAQEIMYKNQIKLMQETLMMQTNLMRGLENEILEKNYIIDQLSKNKSIFARIKTIFQ